MSLGQYIGLGPGGSVGINDQLTLGFPAQAFFPGQAQAPTFNGGLKTPPTLAYPTGLSQVGYPVGMLNDPSGAVAAASAAPFSPVHSPVLWAIAFILIGIIGLRHIHFRGIDNG